jgi:heme/copper-type cytochrome/quinol oxidase subunit 4
MEFSSMRTLSLPPWLQKPPAALVLTSLLLLWQAATWLFEPSPFLLPDPISIGQALVANPGMYLINAYYTAANTLLGFGLSVVIGFVLALGIVYSRFLEATVYTTLVAINSMPKVALAPLFVVWMGTGNTSKVAMAFLIAIFAIVIEAVLGLRGFLFEAVYENVIATAEFRKASDILIAVLEGCGERVHGQVLSAIIIIEWKALTIAVLSSTIPSKTLKSNARIRSCSTRCAMTSPGFRKNLGRKIARVWASIWRASAKWSAASRRPRRERRATRCRTSIARWACLRPTRTTQS